jgi:hypothetical protein
MEFLHFDQEGVERISPPGRLYLHRLGDWNGQPEAYYL